MKEIIYRYEIVEQAKKEERCNGLLFEQSICGMARFSIVSTIPKLSKLEKAVPPQIQAKMVIKMAAS